MRLIEIMDNLRAGQVLCLLPDTSEETNLRVELLDLSGLVNITTRSDGVRTVSWKMELSPGKEEDYLMDGIVKFKQKGGIIGDNRK